MMFAVEVDGGIHLDPVVAARDRDREALLREKHIHFYRWSVAAVETELDSLLYALALDLGLETKTDQAPLLPDVGEGVAG